MKILPFLFAFSALCAAEYKVILPAGPGPEQIYFLDLDKTGADSSSFKLTTAAGNELPFSFDMRLLDPDMKGRKSPDGYRTWSTAPAKENRFCKPGWLSFKSVPGAEKYIFTFRDGAEETVARPDPAVRAWWIELSKAPQFKNLKMLYFKKGDLTPLPEGGYRATGIIRFRKNGFDLDPRGAGRRILGWMRLRSPGGRHHFSVQYRNETSRQAAALTPYFTLPPNEIVDLAVVGIVCKDPAQVIRSRGYAVWISVAKNSSLDLFDFRVQLPPLAQEPAVRMNSSIFNADDEISFFPTGLENENIFPFVSGKIKGFRVGSVTGKISVAARLLDQKGRVLLSGKDKIHLRKIEPGLYTVEVSLLADGMLLKKQLMPITVQQGPF
ncbi:MAG: hypothetical protein IKC65_02175 [Lentisphaeria bacterium]|nr:hypothetical protein [Lentisphaeria bacterium]